MFFYSHVGVPFTIYHQSMPCWWAPSAAEVVEPWNAQWGPCGFGIRIPRSCDLRVFQVFVVACLWTVIVGRKEFGWKYDRRCAITPFSNDKVLSSTLTCKCSCADALCKALLLRSSLLTSRLLASVQFRQSSYRTIHWCYSLPRLFPETAVEKFPTDVIPLAEACIFYESKCTLGCIVLCRKACTSPKVVWRGVIEEVDTCPWLSQWWKCLFAPIQAEFSWNMALTEGWWGLLWWSENWGTEEWLQLAKHLIYDSQMDFFVQDSLWTCKFGFCFVFVEDLRLPFGNANSWGILGTSNICHCLSWSTRRFNSIWRWL